MIAREFKNWPWLLIGLGLGLKLNLGLYILSQVFFLLDTMRSLSSHFFKMKKDTRIIIGTCPIRSGKIPLCGNDLDFRGYINIGVYFLVDLFLYDQFYHTLLSLLTSDSITDSRYIWAHVPQLFMQFE